MAKWRKDTYRMAEGVHWPVKPGYVTFIADQGAVRFDIPRDWIVEPSDNSIKIQDRESPDDTCVLEMSVFWLAPDIDWTELSLTELLQQSVDDPEQQVLSRGRPVYTRRGDLEIAWLETRCVDPGEHREARSRCCLARRGGIQPLITFAYWPEDVPRVLPAWDEMLRSLRLGEYVAFPGTRGRN